MRHKRGGGGAQALRQGDAGVEQEPSASGAGPVGSSDIRVTGVVRWAHEGEDDFVYESGFELIDGEVVVEGDIVLGTLAETQQGHDRLTRLLLDDSQTPEAATEKAFLRTRRSWGGGVVPYMVADGLDCAIASGRIVGGDTRCLNIQAGVDHWNGLTPMTGMRWEFRSSIKGRKKGVRFTGGDTRSRVGEHTGRQDLHLESGVGLGAVQHEMLHAMGLYHEHQRPVRDDFIIVKDEFINRGFRSTFSNIRAIRDQRHRRQIGRYDVDSIMHYASIGNSLQVGVYPRTLALGSREQLVSWSLSSLLWTPGGEPPPVGVLQFPASWNLRARLGFEGVELSRLAVTDVEGDGFDDVIGTLDGHYFWSSQGRTGWRAVLGADGEPVSAGADAFWGEFDAHEGRDVMVWLAEGRRLDVASSDGTRWTRTLPLGATDVATADHDGDGDTDVFVLQRSNLGTVDIQVLDGASIRSGSLEPWATIPVSSSAAPRPVAVRFEVVEVAALVFEPVLFDERNSSERPSLVRLPRGATAWVNVFGTARGPLPAHVRLLAQLHFVELDRWSGSRPVIDILTHSLSGQGVPTGAPLMIRNAFEPCATLVALQYGTGVLEQGFGADLRTDLVGRFESRQLASILSYGSIVRCASPPVPSDVLALASIYNRTLLAQLSDRTPGVGCGVDLSVPVELTLGGGERAELEASFVDPGGSLTLARVLVERVLANGTQTLEDRSVPLSGRADHVEHVFARTESGSYRVRVFYDTREEPAATWLIRVETCGDGRLNPDEQCDDGRGNSDVAPDACRTTCEAPGCGDGVLDTGEECEPGVTSGPCTPFCRVTGPTCGNGAIEPGEECDDGTGNSDTSSDACRTICVLPFCGDLVVDTGEECEPPNANFCLASCIWAFE
jgi:hypothetical protein